MNKTTFKSAMLILAGVLGMSCLSLTASAAVGPDDNTSAKTHWAKHHPRRAQVNRRLARQNRRIHHEVKEGELSRSQAAKLHKEDRSIRQQERDMAQQNGGHITKSEQKTLNQQEQNVSHQIGK